MTTDRETYAIQRLHAAVEAIHIWAAHAYVNGTTPEAWAHICATITDLGTVCTDLGRTIHTDEES